MENTWPILAGFIEIYLCGDEWNTWFTVGNFRIVFTRGLKWWFMDIFRKIRVNGMKARERLGRTFLWDGRAGRLLGPNLKETFLVYSCLQCVSGAQLLFEMEFPVLFSLLPFKGFKGSLSVVKAFSPMVIDADRNGVDARTMLVRYEIKVRIALDFSFPVYLCCARFIFKIQEITRLRFFATKIYWSANHIVFSHLVLFLSLSYIQNYRRKIYNYQRFQKKIRWNLLFVNIKRKKIGEKCKISSWPNFDVLDSSS